MDEKTKHNNAASLNSEFGPITHYEYTCARCNSIVEGAYYGFYSCKKCDSIVTDVKFRPVRLFLISAV